MKKRHILIVAYVFPPIMYAGTYRTLRLVKRMQAQDVVVHVLTIQHQDDLDNDHELLSRVPDNVLIHRTFTIDPWRRFQVMKRRYGDRPWFKIIDKLVSLILTFITFPDHMVLWVPFAVVRGLKLIMKYGIHSVYVSSPPHSTQLIGVLLKKAARIKFIADFRDPIMGNVGDPRLNNPTDILSMGRKKLFEYFEKTVLHTADVIVTNTYTHRDQLHERFKTKKICTVHNSFDEDDYSHAQVEKYQKFTIAHIGSMYGTRNADVLFRAIRLLEQEVEPSSLNLEVLFAGMNDRNLQEKVRDEKLDTYVKIRGVVPHRDAMEIMMRAHLLLLIKMTGTGSLGQIPGKFFEYLGTRNRIICIGPKQSEVAQMIEEMGVGFTVEHDELEMFRILKDAYSRFLQGSCEQNLNNKISGYSAENMARQLAGIILSSPEGA